MENLTRLGAGVLLEVADNDQQKQIAQAQKMINNGAKVLIVIPIDQAQATERNCSGNSRTGMEPGK